MAVQVRQMLLTYGRGGRPGTRLLGVRGIVIHWTANMGKGANAVANRNYFENNPEKHVSAHYIVDDHQIIQCVPDNEVAYHVGAKRYNPEAVAKLGSYPNGTTIGIEMCVNADGDFKITYMNTVKLVVDLLHKYNLTVANLYRHYDITGKDCPRFFVDDATARQYGFPTAEAFWEQFKEDVSEWYLGMKGEEGMGQNYVPYAPAKVEVNGKVLTGYIINDKTYVPVRDIAEALGLSVAWNPNAKTVTVK